MRTVYQLNVVNSMKRLTILVEPIFTKLDSFVVCNTVASDCIRPFYIHRVILPQAIAANVPQIRLC